MTGRRRGCLLCGGTLFVVIMLLGLNDKDVKIFYTFEEIIGKAIYKYSFSHGCTDWDK